MKQTLCQSLPVKKIINSADFFKEIASERKIVVRRGCSPRSDVTSTAVRRLSRNGKYIFSSGVFFSLDSTGTGSSRNNGRGTKLLMEPFRRRHKAVRRLSAHWSHLQVTGLTTNGFIGLLPTMKVWAICRLRFITQKWKTLT